MYLGVQSLINYGEMIKIGSPLLEVNAQEKLNASRILLRSSDQNVPVLYSSRKNSFPFN